MNISDSKWLVEGEAAWLAYKPLTIRERIRNYMYGVDPRQSFTKQIKATSLMCYI